MSVLSWPLLFKLWKNNYSEYDSKLDEFTDMEVQINNIKKRTAKGYGIKDTAVWWLFQEYKETLNSKWYCWDGYVQVNNLKLKCIVLLFFVVPKHWTERGHTNCPQRIDQGPFYLPQIPGRAYEGAWNHGYVGGMSD